MKRLGGAGTDIVTTVHKLVAVVWAAGAVIALVIAAQLAMTAGATAADWARVALFQGVAAYASVAMLLIGLVYSIWTPWGFFRNRWVIAKWVLFIVATALGGPAMGAAQTHASGVVIALTAGELAALAAAALIGLRLVRQRHRRTVAG